MNVSKERLLYFIVIVLLVSVALYTFVFMLNPKPVTQWETEPEVKLPQVSPSQGIPNQVSLNYENHETSFVDVHPKRVFKASRFFRERRQPNGIKFHFDSNFRILLAKVGKAKAIAPAATLNVYRYDVFYGDNGSSIFEEFFGNNTRAITGLAYVAALIEKQPRGKKGILAINGEKNTFYILDPTNGVVEVSCYWNSEHSRWEVTSDLVENRNGNGWVFFPI